jgi:hypothetical protein
MTERDCLCLYMCTNWNHNILWTYGDNNSCSYCAIFVSPHGVAYSNYMGVV